MVRLGQPPEQPSVSARDDRDPDVADNEDCKQGDEDGGNGGGGGDDDDDDDGCDEHDDSGGTGCGGGRQRPTKSLPARLTGKGATSTQSPNWRVRRRSPATFTAAAVIARALSSPLSLPPRAPLSRPQMELLPSTSSSSLLRRCPLSRRTPRQRSSALGGGGCASLASRAGAAAAAPCAAASDKSASDESASDESAPGGRASSGA